ncbi:MAG: 5'/3'-nucleotidase SurE [Caldilineaceae bacterium]
MPTILVTNDDGVQTPGLLALKQALTQVGDVIVLAPERNWSATSHAKTMHKPLRMQRVMLADGSAGHSCSGSPTDCVSLVAAGILEVKPDLVVSGINNGYNLGNDVTYSGTVACAIEATIVGMPGIAVSTARTSPNADMAQVWKMTAEFAARLAQMVLQKGLPAQTLLNVNVPALPVDQVRGYEITRIGRRTYNDQLIKREDPYGQPYYWLGGSMPTDFPDDGTDVNAVANGLISVTPLCLDMTNYAFLKDLQAWTL